ncbi:MAG: hypothetical protein HOV68_23100, partial [Streptomycetaceae bacterium]|nr:hypothetical protein [Streptomycetaceae bacterium]
QPEVSVPASAQQRYLIVESLVFDLSARTAACYAGDDHIRGVALTSVGDNGVAYGTLRDDEDGKPDPVLVRLATRAVEPLPEGTLLPQLITRGGVGLFTVSGKGTDDTAGEDDADSEEAPATTTVLLPPAGSAPPQPQ